MQPLWESVHDRQISVRVLNLVNEARSRPRRCGNQMCEAARPLTLNAQLGRAALWHSQDMARFSFTNHQGRNGSTPEQRVTRAGYPWAATAENVAAGPGTAEEVMAAWLARPAHCANIMGARYTDMGVAVVVSRQGAPRSYWTLSLAAPRESTLRK